jgi:hypothetical protein
MADPLSMSVNILALAGAATKLGNFARSVRHAPKELLSLSDEVSDLTALITKLENMRSNREIPETWLEDLAEILAPLKSKVEQLSGLVGTFDRSNAIWELLDRLRWPLTQSKIKALQSDLRDIRLNIITFVSIKSS